MKINIKDLKLTYKAHLLNNISISRNNCPSFKKILSFFTSMTSEKKKIKIIDHVTNCYYCAQEFQFILTILKFKKNLNKELFKFFDAIKGNPIKKIAEQSVSILNKKKKYNRSLLFWKYVIPFFGAIILLFVSIVYLNLNNKEYRTYDNRQTQLIEPICSKSSNSSIVFRWSELPSSSYYIVELFDETLLPVWKSDKTYSNFISISNEVLKDLNKNKKYFCMITAFMPEGKKVESDMKEFSLLE